MKNTSEDEARSCNNIIEFSVKNRLCSNNSGKPKSPDVKKNAF